MRIVLSGGGTAGHINPALALAEVLIERGHEVMYAGTPNGVESKLVPAAGIPFKGFEAAGFDRSHPLSLAKGLRKISKSSKLAVKWFLEIRPDVVVVFGGYVCLPFSLIWGVFCVFIVKCFQPLVAHLIGYIPHIAGIVILVILSIAMLADLYVTASAILKLNKRLEAMEKIAAELREFSDRMGENIYENVKDGMEKEEQLKSKVASMKEVRKELRAEYSAGKEEWYKSQQQKLDELKGRYDSLVNGLGSVGERLVKAFPNMESRIHKDALREVKKRVAMRRNKRK